eukprot:gnl/MRDRNA2_/MRDRNA2_37522_c0_seq1.p1 gnl/MRDRNA2_/MRDRNA2_37522_c0~~gnl/MRDRNA2_/MRDRNA2_37522_c0_seq1.p1  ORF type:complete len:108 (-),score=2.86 gnl/MRDRNA2_/MRDRNA2_37522_c0_seq1:235-558(-)
MRPSVVQHADKWMWFIKSLCLACVPNSSPVVRAIKIDLVSTAGFCRRTFSAGQYRYVSRCSSLEAHTGFSGSSLLSSQALFALCLLVRCSELTPRIFDGSSTLLCLR